MGGGSYCGPKIGPQTVMGPRCDPQSGAIVSKHVVLKSVFKSSLKTLQLGYGKLRTLKVVVKLCICMITIISVPPWQIKIGK